MDKHFMYQTKRHHFFQKWSSNQNQQYSVLDNNLNQTFYDHKNYKKNKCFTKNYALSVNNDKENVFTRNIYPKKINCFQKTLKSKVFKQNLDICSIMSVKTKLNTTDEVNLFYILLHHFPNWVSPASSLLKWPSEDLLDFVNHSIQVLGSLTLVRDFAKGDFLFLCKGRFFNFQFCKFLYFYLDFEKIANQS